MSSPELAPAFDPTSALGGWLDRRRRLLRDRVELAALLPSSGRGLVLVVVLLGVAAGVMPVLAAVAGGYLVGTIPDAIRLGIDSSAGHRLLLFLALTAAVFVVSQSIWVARHGLTLIVGRRVDGVLRERLIAAALRGPGLGELESGRVRDLLARASPNNPYTLGDAAGGLLALIPPYLSAFGAAILISRFSWPVAVVFVAVVLPVRFRFRSGTVRLWNAKAAGTGSAREAAYFVDLGLGAAAAKELRLFGLSDWLLGRFRVAAVAAERGVWEARRRVLERELAGTYVLGALGGGGAYLLMGHEALAGQITLTQLVIVMQASGLLLSLGGFLVESDYQLENGTAALSALREIEAEVQRGLPRVGRRDPAGLPTREIRFERVSFRYPGGDREVLTDCELTLRAGESVAIVGLNGAGKTTLVKLLARLYEPAAGSILVDGVDLRELDADAWQQRIGIIFQDFIRYELPARDNIGLRARGERGSEQAVRLAAEHAGVLAALERLPQGLETVLSRRYQDGADLSGGQWQRVALARALFAVQTGAGVLVLDEPTANLDVRAEVALFDRFVELTEGVTTVLVSHRFSTVRKARRICVLEHGRIVEDGSHEELLARGGRYAEMFTLQAAHFGAPSDEAKLDALDDAHELGEAARDA
jgi:ATP-binding cassette, subfamily B, bacterial